MKNDKEVKMRRITVAQADLESVVGPNLVAPTATLEEIVASFEQSPRTLTLAVVDEKNQLLGLIPFRQVVEEIFLQVSPEIFLQDIHSFSDAEQFAVKTRLSNATTAKEMMLPPLFVRPNDTIVEAFSKMQTNRLTGLPIVDDSLVVIGYLDLLELVMIWHKTSANAKNPTTLPTTSSQPSPSKEKETEAGQA